MHYSKEEKTMWLDDWRQSGKGAWAYARENGLIPQTFFGWTKKEEKVKSDFVEVHPKAIMPVTQGLEILIEKGDVRIHIPLGISRGELHMVMEGLGAAL